MAKSEWTTKRVSVASLYLDQKNPRLGRETLAQAPREIIQYLFEHDKALDVAESIATRGFFVNEPLLAVMENNRLVVVEGNRRLAALKALKEPGLLEGAVQRQVEKLSRKILDQQLIASVPVTVASSRKATDRQIAGRHIGTPVLAWQAENRASFILDKLAEGYDNNELRDELGFSLADIQSARQTRAVADMARSLKLSDEIKAKLDNPRAKIFTTLGRVVDSTVGRKYLHLEKDADHGLRGTTAKAEFVKAFTKLVTDVALGNQSSRTLNTSDDIEAYFKSWSPAEKAKKTKAAFVPSEIIEGKSVASPAKASPSPATKKSKAPVSTVLPRDFKIRHGTDRLVDIRSELVKLKREDFPNAGAVLLRVFLELAVTHYLERTGAMKGLIEKLGGKGKLPFGVPQMKQMTPTITKIAKEKLDHAAATKVEKALRYDAAAPFSLSELHAFIHQAGDLPNDRDIWQFWLRTEPLFRLMLEADEKEDLK